MPIYTAAVGIHKPTRDPEILYRVFFSKFFLDVSHISRRRNAHTRLSQRAHRDDLCLSLFVLLVGIFYNHIVFFFFFSHYTHYLYSNISPAAHLRTCIDIIYRYIIVKSAFGFSRSYSHRPYDFVSNSTIPPPPWYFGREVVKCIIQF